MISFSSFRRRQRPFRRRLRAFLRTRHACRTPPFRAARRMGRSARCPRHDAWGARNASLRVRSAPCVMATFWSSPIQPASARTPALLARSRAPAATITTPANRATNKRARWTPFLRRPNGTARRDGRHCRRHPTSRQRTGPWSGRSSACRSVRPQRPRRRFRQARSAPAQIGNGHPPTEKRRAFFPWQRLDDACSRPQEGATASRTHDGKRAAPWIAPVIGDCTATAIVPWSGWSGDPKTDAGVHRSPWQGCRRPRRAPFIARPRPSPAP